MARIIDFSEHVPERCARVGFLPSGSYQESFGSAHSFCSGFSCLFLMGGVMDFSRICQKDAQGSFSSLRVRIKRVWALRTRLAIVFGGS